MRLTHLFLVILASVALATPAAAVMIGTDGGRTPDVVDAISGQVQVQVSTDVDVIQFDLQAAYDPTYWEFVEVLGAAFIEIDTTRGYIDDIFGDVGTGDPIAAGSTLFTLVFDVIGSPLPERTVLEVGDLTGLDSAFFDRAVLIADPDFNILLPDPNGFVNTVPEPSTAMLTVLGLAALAAGRRRARGR